MLNKQIQLLIILFLKSGIIFLMCLPMQVNNSNTFNKITFPFSKCKSVHFFTDSIIIFDFCKVSMEISDMTIDEELYIFNIIKYIHWLMNCNFKFFILIDSNINLFYQQLFDFGSCFISIDKIITTDENEINYNYKQRIGKLDIFVDNKEIISKINVEKICNNKKLFYITDRSDTKVIDNCSTFKYEKVPSFIYNFSNYCVYDDKDKLNKFCD